MSEREKSKKKSPKKDKSVKSDKVEKEEKVEKKQPPEQTPEEKAAILLFNRRKGGLSALAEIVCAIFETWNATGQTKETDGLTKAANYKRNLEHANYKFGAHKKYFSEFYDKYVNEFRLDTDDLDIVTVRNKLETWFSKSVIFHLGHDLNGFANKKCILSFSKAYNFASVLRDNIEEKCTGRNPEKDAVLRKKFEYLLLDNLILRLFNVFVLCFENDNDRKSDYTMVKAIFDVAQNVIKPKKEKKPKKPKSDSQSGSEGDTDEEEEEDGPIGPLAGMAKLFNVVTKNKGIYAKASAELAKIQEESKKNGEAPDYAEIMSKMGGIMGSLGPEIKEIGKELGMEVPNKKGEKSESSSETDSDSESS